MMALRLVERKKSAQQAPSIRRRTDRLNHRRFPQFSRHLRSASLHSGDEKIGSPVARFAAAARWLTPPAPRRAMAHLSLVSGG